MRPAALTQEWLPVCIFFFRNQGPRPSFTLPPVMPSFPVDYPTRNDSHLYCVALTLMFVSVYLISPQQIYHETHHTLTHSSSVLPETLRTWISPECISFSCPIILWMLIFKAYTFRTFTTLLT